MHEYKVILVAQNWAMLMITKNWNFCIQYDALIQNKEKTCINWIKYFIHEQ